MRSLEPLRYMPVNQRDGELFNYIATDENAHEEGHPLPTVQQPSNNNGEENFLVLQNDYFQQEAFVRVFPTIEAAVHRDVSSDVSMSDDDY